MTWSVSNESAPVRRAPAKRARACPTESQEQKSLFKWWRVYSRHAPHLVMYHIPNGGRRDAITGARRPKAWWRACRIFFLPYPGRGSTGCTSS